MSFSIFGNGHKKAKGALIVDVGSSSVGVAITIFETGIKPRIVFEMREQIPLQARLNRQRLLPSMILTLEKALEESIKRGLSKAKSQSGDNVNIEKIVCSFSSPWHVSTTRFLHFKFEKTFSINHNFVSDILSYEGKNFLSSIAKDSSLDIKSDHDKKFVMAEQKILRAMVNGYPLNNLFGKNAEEFELALFLSAIPSAVKKSVERCCGKHFPNIIPDCYSSTSVYFNVLRIIFPKENSFMIVHISGETTDVSVVKKGIITETMSFPLGRNFIVRRLIEDIKNVTPAIALSMMRLNAEGLSSSKLSEKIKSVLSQAESDWIQLFSDAIKDFSKDFFLPTKIFVLAGDNSSKTFAELITNKKLLVRGIGTPSLVAEPIDTPLFLSEIEGEESDTFLSALVFFVKEEYFEDF